MRIERELLRRISSHSESRIPAHFIYEIQELLAQPEPEPSVKLPESEDEAVLMNLLSDNWLRNHAPHRLNQPEQEPVGIVITIGGYPDDSEHTVKLTCRHKDLKDGDLLYTAPQKRKHLTGIEISQGFQTDDAATHPYSYWSGVDFAEKAHGITGGEE